MAPVVLQLKSNPRISCKVLVTGQHREMLDQVLKLFGIVPDYDLDIMSKAQKPGEVLASIIQNITPILENLRPNIVLVHGDTATTSAASIAAYLQKIKIGHIEAGLRTYDLYSPWPEEGNRKIVAAIRSSLCPNGR